MEFRAMINYIIPETDRFTGTIDWTHPIKVFHSSVSIFIINY
jgi:hypothetical protein